MLIRAKIWVDYMIQQMLRLFPQVNPNQAERKYEQVDRFYSVCVTNEFSQMLKNFCLD